MEAGFIPAGGGGGGGGPAPGHAIVAPSAPVVRAPGLKRGRMEEAISDRIKLETVFGLTVSSNAALDCDPNTQLVAYTAGCTVVLYNARKNRQSHIINTSRRSVTCVAFSSCGRYLATGECGHAPCVRVWDLQDPTASGAVQIAEFPGHTHGVNCVSFSTSSKYLVSVGSQHDMIVNVWDWRANLKLASNKVSSRVKAISFSESGTYFVTVGFRHVKFWYLEYSRNAKIKEPVPLMGRSAILGEQKDNEFCDVVCGRGGAAESTYAITRGGLLCEFNSRRLLDKWVELRTSSANCMAIGSRYIIVGCAEGIVRVFAPHTLQYVTTLPRCHYLGVDVAGGHDISHMFSAPAGARYPDAIALTYDERNHKLTCVYNDHSLYVWDVRDIARVGKSHSALYHSACIWGVDMCGGEAGGGGTLLTCSSDDTVRAWTLGGDVRAQTNIYTNELTKIIYIDPDLKFLKDADLTAAGDKDKSKTYDDKTGVRCVRVSPDGEHIASGDRAGNVWIHARGGDLLRTLEAHDAEVLCVEYSARPRLLASASRDRLIHVFNVDQGYQILQTLDEHSSSITAVRFLNSGSGLQMVSCGADKTILFRRLQTTQDGGMVFARGVNVSGRSTLYDMEVDAGDRHVLAACQDRNVRVYSAAHARHTKTFRGTPAEDGTLIKVALDVSGIYLATSSTDKILSVYDYYSGECMATMCGHSEIVTGLKFTPDCKHLVSAGGDGCVFVWRVPHDMSVTMRARLAQQAIRHGRRPATNGADSEGDSQWGSPPRDAPPAPLAAPAAPANDYTLRVGRLPSWAKKSLGDELGGGDTPGAPPAPPRGKWAARVQPQQEKRVDSDGSKDSSLDSGTDTRYFDRRRDHKQVSIDLSGSRTSEARSRHHTDDSSLGSFKYEDQESTEHDGDIEDISDGERVPSTRPTYYPGNNLDSPGEFLVNAMDAEELRQSVRRKRPPPAPASPAPSPAPTHATAASLSSPHDSDDDEASTPSGDNLSRALSGSSESLDVRTRLLHSAYDDLGHTTPGNHHTGHNSLSSQHLRGERTPAPPLASPRGGGGPPVGGGGAGGPADPDVRRRREELNRRILETRRQLESVAFRSTLKASQSTTDLSRAPRPAPRPVSQHIPPASHTPYGLPTYPEDALDSLNNFYDSLTPYQNTNYDYRNKNPYAIPANLNHKIPEYIENIAPYTPPHDNLKRTVKEKKSTNFPTYTKPVVFKEQISQRQNLAFTIDMGKPQSKVFNRLFPTKEATETQKRNFQLNLTKTTDEKPQKLPKPNARSIFKNYKSCPVSPVSEECKWSDKVQQQQSKANNNSLDPKKRNSLSFFVGLDNKAIRDNGKSIVDSIKSDTEKMIAEITKKYGDLDEYDVSAHDDLDLQPTKEVEKDDGNFSSDSLEDCSLSQDASCKNKLYSKKICKKHNKAKSLPRRAVSDYEICDKPTVPVKPAFITDQKSSTLPRNMPSNLDDVEDENFNINSNFMYRCQSVLTKRCITRSNESVLSDNSNGSSVSNEIFLKYGNEVAFQQARYDSRYTLDSNNCSFENLNEPDAKYLDNHRHSSASFFLNQKKYMKTSCSQESVLSDDMYLENDNQLCRTNCNSLESVLSDDSECTKSAPLEMLFEGTKTKRMQRNPNVNIPRNSNSCYEFNNSSKSYGSSPNNAPSFANYYTQYSYLGSSPQKDVIKEISTTVIPNQCHVNKTYGFEVPVKEFSGHKTVTRSKSLHDSTQPPPAKPIAYYFDGDKIQAYTKPTKKDEIPRLNTATYSAGTSKSLQPQFASQHKYKSVIEGCEPDTVKSNAMIKSKSCSFEVVLEPASKPNPIKNLLEKRNSHVQKNLEKFEEQIRKNQQNKVIKNHLNKEKASSKNNATKSLERGSTHKNNGKVTMEFVPHKPPKPAKRTSSVKINNKHKASLDKAGLSSSISSQYKAKLDGLQNKNFLAKRHTDNNTSLDSDGNEKTFDVFVKEKDVNDNKSEMQMDSLEVYAMQRMERMKQVSMDSLDILEERNDFAQDSLDYYAEQKNNNFVKSTKEQRNIWTKADVTPCHSKQSDVKENIAPKEHLQKFKYLERKIDIINKLVEMEERKMLQEKVLKEWRMRPLTANINDGKGVVKVLSRKFEKLATKQSTVPNFASLTMEEAETDVEKSENKEIKRNLSLPDILDSDQVGEINSNFSKEVKVTDNESGNQNVDDTNINESKTNNNTAQNNVSTIEIGTQATKLNNTVKSGPIHPKSLKQRVYNEMVIPKTDVHLDSENYESSTTSSSCTNSPKRMTFFGFSRAKTPFRKVVRVPTPRLCMERPRPMISLCRPSLARRLPFQAPVLPSKFAASRSHLSPSDAEDGGSMRRAISLSDLAAKPMPAPRHNQAPAKQSSAVGGGGGVGAGGGGAGAKSPSGFVRPAPRHHTNMTRSSSVGVLNQSDSESDGHPSRRPGGGGGGGGAGGGGNGGLMRPTISSMNKQAAARRRGLASAHSAMSLSTCGGRAPDGDSSSEAEERPSAAAAPPPRPRAGSVDHRRMGRSGSERDLSAKAREVTARLTAGGGGGGGAGGGGRPRKDERARDADQNLSSSELCAALTDQLTRAAARVVQLYRSLQHTPHAHTDVSGLEAAILETQKVLRSAVTSHNGDASPPLARTHAPPPAGERDGDSLHQLLTRDGTGPAMSLIEQYSDILLNMMQNKMVNQTAHPPPGDAPPS